MAIAWLCGLECGSMSVQARHTIFGTFLLSFKSLVSFCPKPPGSSDKILSGKKDSFIANSKHLRKGRYPLSISK